MQFKNYAERHFAEYLDARGLAWQHENEAGAKRPDFWVAGPESTVVCEVRHVTAALTGSGSFDVYAPLTKAIKRKSGQGRGLDPSTPYVVVLWAPSWPTDEFAVSGAAFGRIHLSIPLDVRTGTADESQAETRFGRDAAMHDSSREHISAVAIIRRFNPLLRAAENEIAESTSDEMTERDRISVIFDVFERRTEEGLFIEDDRCVRLVVHHNPYAAVPLGTTTFNGPHDVQFGPIDGGYGKVSAGDRVDDLPND